MWKLKDIEELTLHSPDCAEYRRKVPAFWTWRFVKFWHFLLTGK
jgi:hypothetical protein